MGTPASKPWDWRSLIPWIVGGALVLWGAGTSFRGPILLLLAAALIFQVMQTIKPAPPSSPAK